jgi:radical SAM superfamily enzyme YgiQ (UPF0313 family)
MKPARYELNFIDVNKQHKSVESTLVRFSAACCFTFDESEQENNCFKALARYLLGIVKQKGPGLALYNNGPFTRRLLKVSPELKQHVSALVLDNGEESPNHSNDISTYSMDSLPNSIHTLFLCETETTKILRCKRLAPKNIDVLDPGLLAGIYWETFPKHAFVPIWESIYPMDVPDIDFKPSQDIILIDCPSRNLGLMPNGVGYVHNALLKDKLAVQTVDLDMIIYHRFHQKRLLDSDECFKTPQGNIIPDDPWSGDHMGCWSNPDFIDFFKPELDEIIEKIGKARPKILGLSISQTSELFSRALVNGVRKSSPDTLILVGGFSCLHPWKGLRAFPECDYMVVGEADLIVGPLCRELIAGKRPKDMAGVFSVFDTPFRTFEPGPKPHDLEVVDFPKYEWAEIKTHYRNYNHYLLTPIVSNRGCRWSRCRFCGERFEWRPRDPVKFADELEWLYKQGTYLFVINDSDLNGDNKIVEAICDEIIRRDLKIKISGQMRIDKRNTRQFFDKMFKAGFHLLRFGVDAWSSNTLRLQNKGYTVDMIRENLKACAEAGIAIEVNAVIGVPGETEQDIDETIALLKENKKYITIFANLNALVLITDSPYWRDPEKYNIFFREDKETIYKNNPNHIPSHLWYSESPYIDEPIRLNRCRRIVEALEPDGFNFGVGARPMINRLLQMEKDAQQAIAAQKGENTQPAPQQETTPAPPEQTPATADVQSCGQPIQPAVNASHFIKTGDLLLRFESETPLDKIKSIKRLNPWSIELVRLNVGPYNIIKVLSDYFAVRHGYPFEFDDFINDKYPKGACLRASTVPELEELITLHSSSPT